jgi:hypothetical protein
MLTGNEASERADALEVVSVVASRVEDAKTAARKPKKRGVVMAVTAKHDFSDVNSAG